ncbi:hypothetical protein FRC14_005019 [Serendipita sp. 396]|nr:hypothetical protein FRC14_005019 [Serendipita sp. 396]KAG8781279.1 hypothetical protein FRC15_008900 [Serendipita sp. 397]KAG8797734.1 hypothetical protein FRC16_008581 [Serendipita sp. 398]KAG8866359.1 hypothetical protein FRC20_008753 [Serendipita sp. 405]
MQMSLDSEEPQAATITSIRYSKIFCEGYGDFRLQSSDGVIFVFPQWLLSYSSPVFQDMFQLGDSKLEVPKPIPEEDAQAATAALSSSSSSLTSLPQPPTALQVTEDALTLDLVLRHIDPRQVVAHINEKTIEKLLEAARKYQLTAIMSWFEAEAVKHVEHPENPIPGISLMTYNPLLVLSLATEYELPHLAQRAACALIGGSSSLLHKDVNIRLNIYRRVHCLREQRVQWYHQRIGTIASKVFRAKPVQPAVCSCGNTRSAWIHLLTDVVLKSPHWKPFYDEVMNPVRRCRPGCGDWGPQVEEDMMVWYHEALQQEQTLPDLGQ